MGDSRFHTAFSFPAGEWKVRIMASNQGGKEIVLEPGKEKREAHARGDLHLILPLMSFSSSWLRKGIVGDFVQHLCMCSTPRRKLNAYVALALKSKS